MIVSFHGKETEKIWKQEYSRKLPKDIQRIGLRKLIMINRAKDLNDLNIPPGNKLEKLIGNSPHLPEPVKEHYLHGQKLRSGRIFFSPLREAPALGAGIDAYLSYTMNAS